MHTDVSEKFKVVAQPRDEFELVRFLFFYDRFAAQMSMRPSGGK